MKHKFSHNKWAHRRLHIAPHYTNPQQGDDVKAFQRAFNALPAGVRGSGIKLKVDGQAGRQTIGRGRHAARALGVGLHGPGLSPYVQHLIRHPKLRTPIQVKRGETWRTEWNKQHPPAATVSGNTATGGTARERVVAAAVQAAHLYATGQSHRFYSQPGAWTVDHGITGETPGRDRSDCSQWVTSTYHSAGAPDPNGANFTGGYTGSMEAHMTEIRREQLQPGDDVIYGPPGATHHTEKWIGNGDGKTTYAQLDKAGSPHRDDTIGHGSPPVDLGDIDMMAGARFFRCPGLD